MADLAKAMGAVATKSVADFRRSMRSAVRRFWDGDIDSGGFVVDFMNAIDRGFRRAYRQGAAQCGVKPNQYTGTMEARLQDMINGQFPHVMDLSTQIERRGDGGKLRPIYNRIELWVARYGEIMNEAKAMACEHQPLEWRLGAAEHCESCLKLDGIVKPASVWRDSGILPRKAGASYLRCRGYNCKCDLVRTDKALTEGPIPALP